MLSTFRCTRSFTQVQTFSRGPTRLLRTGTGTFLLHMTYASFASVAFHNILVQQKHHFRNLLSSFGQQTLITNECVKWITEGISSLQVSLHKHTGCATDNGRLCHYVFPDFTLDGFHVLPSLDKFIMLRANYVLELIRAKQRNSFCRSGRRPGNSDSAFAKLLAQRFHAR